LQFKKISQNIVISFSLLTKRTGNFSAISLGKAEGSVQESTGNGTELQLEQTQA